MKQAFRVAAYDKEIGLEACRFQGISQPFPRHFHEYYVIGLIESGEHLLFCRDREEAVGKGCLLLFCPGDVHGCVQTEGALDYRSLHLSPEVMKAFTKELTGRELLPRTEETVFCDSEAVSCFRTLHELVMCQADSLGKEEALLLLLSVLLKGQEFAGEKTVSAYREEIASACAYLEKNYAQTLSLSALCRHTGLSKSTLLRAFAKEKGTTPYRYLESFRIGKAKQLLEQGASPLEAALATGFSDQSHFTNYFTGFLGISPGAYRRIFSGRSGNQEELNWNKKQKNA